MEKRGQITFFLIIGIIIVVIFALVFSLRSEISSLTQKVGLQEESALSIEASKAKGLVQGCIKQKLEEGLLLWVGQGGRFYINPNNTELFYHYLVPVYKVNETVKFETIDYIEDELEFFISFGLPRCSAISEYNFSEKEPKSEIQIKNNVIEANVKWRVFVGNGSRKVDQFFVKFPINFLSLHSELKTIQSKFLNKNDGLLDVVLGTQGNYTLGVETIDNTTFYSMIFNNMKFNNVTLVYNIGMKYSGR